MKRRQFLKTTFLGVGVVAATGGALWLSPSVDENELSLEVALQKLENLSQQSLFSSGKWQVAQIFNHCAQSVEYSMEGFPAHKSDFFKNTLGTLAFSVFSMKGKMKHSLSEPIPAAPFLSSTDIKSSLIRLMSALLAFENYEGVLAPHFAYGVLNKKDYTLAHVLHLNNHLQEINYAL